MFICRSTLLTGALALTVGQAQAVQLFSDRLAPATPGIDLTTYDANYVVSTTGSGNPPTGFPVHEIASDGGGVLLSTRVGGGNPQQSITRLTNAVGFTPSGTLGRYNAGTGEGQFFAGALFNYDSLSFVQENGRVSLGTSIVGQHVVEFGIESINDAGDFRAFALNGNNRTTASISAADADANGNVLLMILWKNQTSGFSSNNSVALGINPTDATGLTSVSGRHSNYSAALVDGAAINDMFLSVRTGSFPGANPSSTGIIESVAFGLTFEDAVPTFFVPADDEPAPAVPEPASAALAALGVLVLARRNRR